MNILNVCYDYFSQSIMFLLTFFFNKYMFAPDSNVALVFTMTEGGIMEI